MNDSANTRSAQMDIDNKDARMGNELPLDFGQNANDLLRGEPRTPRESSGWRRSLHRLKTRGVPVLMGIVVLVILIYGLAALLKLVLNPNLTTVNAAVDSAAMIEVAKSQLTESSIKKLIEESAQRIAPGQDQSNARLVQVEQTLQALQEGQAKQLEALNELKKASDALKTQVDTHELAIEQINKRLEPMLTEKRPVVIQRDANSFTEARKKSRKSIAPDPKPLVVPVPFPPVRLVSIKNFNGKSGITLSVDGEQSGLVLVGQIWRGFMVISADSSQRVATIARDGAIKNLTL